jgi:hypothetical protein
MATLKQKRVVQKIIENHGNLGKAMIEAGYEENTAKNPKRNLTESKGFKELCDEHGLTDDLILDSLVEDIRKKPQNRKPELELGSKIKGLLQDRLDITSNGKVVRGFEYVRPKTKNNTNSKAGLSMASSSK